MNACVHHTFLLSSIWPILRFQSLWCYMHNILIQNCPAGKAYEELIPGTKSTAGRMVLQCCAANSAFKTVILLPAESITFWWSIEPPVGPSGAITSRRQPWIMDQGSGSSRPAPLATAHPPPFSFGPLRIPPPYGPLPLGLMGTSPSLVGCLIPLSWRPRPRSGGLFFFLSPHSTRISKEIDEWISKWMNK